MMVDMDMLFFVGLFLNIHICRCWRGWGLAVGWVV